MSNGGNHYGDSVTQTGGVGNTGIIKNQGVPADPQAAFREMMQAIQVLRGQISAEDRQVIDASLNTIGAGTAPGGEVDPGTLRRALAAIAGVATVVGEVGAPVVAAIQRVLALIGGA
ncbi:hypothetical protein AB0O76_36320 [Streptomyces sp. NPDC086554]|uniref:hypothetical protein n=1 Tax=Streptomyces sp. NPDC086554 TaxID=3154864 RepID=UPI003448C554